MTMLKLQQNVGPTSLAYISEPEKKLLKRREAMKGFPSKKEISGVPVLADSRAAIKDIKSAGEVTAPVKRGKVKLAYITEGEEELLLRRDEKQGSTTRKYSPEGIPILEGGWEGGGHKGAVKSASGGRPVKRTDPRLQKSNYYVNNIISPTVRADVLSGRRVLSEVDLDRIAEGMMLPPATKKVKPPKPPKPPTPRPTGGGGGGSGGSPSAGVSVITRPGPDPTVGSPAATPVQDFSINVGPGEAIDTSQLEQPLLEEIVVLGPKSEVLEERLKNLINTNSPLFKAATTKALQSMNSAGLTNSSIAQEAVMAAILGVAIPIAQQDAQTFLIQRMANQTASNTFKAAQNAAYYEAFQTKLTGQINQTLRQLADRSANWRAILAERGAIARTAGMSKDAAENALELVTPEWF